jgi:Fic family protein
VQADNSLKVPITVVIYTFEVPNTDVVRELNEQLRGSPYALPADEFGAKRATFLLEECESIELRQRSVELEFVAQNEEIRERVESMIRVREVYESNALESAGLDLASTEQVISEAGNTLDELTIYIAQQAIQSDRHLMEVLGLEQALLFARQLADDFHSESLPIREIDIRNLHRFTVPFERHAGSYKGHEVAISGATVTPSSFIDVEEYVRQLVEWLNTSTVSPPLAAAAIHSWLTIIHPFEDGNGRVARLLANIVLIRARWPPLIIRASDRLQYLDALSQSDEAGDILPLFDLFVKSIKRGLRELQKPDLAKRLFDADLRRQPDRRYELWCQMLTDFVNDLRSHLYLNGFDLHRLGRPPVSTFLLLEERERAANTWFAKIQRQDRSADLLLWLGYSTTEMLDGSARNLIAPAVFISERDHRPDATSLYIEPWNSNRFSIRELAIYPTSDVHPVDVRFGRDTVIAMSIAEAAQRLAADISEAFPKRQ